MNKLQWVGTVTSVLIFAFLVFTYFDAKEEVITDEK